MQKRDTITDRPKSILRAFGIAGSSENSRVRSSLQFASTTPSAEVTMLLVEDPDQQRVILAGQSIATPKTAVIEGSIGPPRTHQA